jgi:prepilin-type processing-associated H-X9-DG protein
MRGFGLRDLIVVVAVVAVLGVVTFFGLRSYRERAVRSQCQQNLRQVGAAMIAFSLAHDGLLPDCTSGNQLYGGGNWPWDMNTNVFNELVRLGITANTLYCPANPTMNNDLHRNFWLYAHNSLMVISYGMLFNGQAMVPQDYWRPNLLGSGASPEQAELGFDATISMDGDFMNIRGFNTDRSNHVQGSQPTGGNILFEDGHVEWRDFKKMRDRFHTGAVTWYF